MGAQARCRKPRQDRDQGDMLALAKSLRR